MQPKVVCLCLLAMLLFTSPGCALPAYNLRHRPNKPAALRKPHNAGLPKLPTPALPPSTSFRKPRTPFKASFLDSQGRPRPNESNKAQRKLRRLAAYSAKHRVRWVLMAILKAHEDDINQNVALRNLFRASVTWERNCVPVGISGEEPVIYFSIEGGICEPHCFGFTVRHPILFSSGSTQMLAYGELHYPNSSPGGFEILAFNGGRDCPEGDPAIQGKLDPFLRFLGGSKDEVKQGKANYPVVWPVLEAESEALSLAPYSACVSGPPTAAPPTHDIDHILAHRLQSYLNGTDGHPTS
ncbi:hypothetical protein BDP27DRAFT_1425469 [Rhodocollybia butyracea]|uniref:Uncharacterized protein n=1 Tax=Rhodocollybia butyracea TaxID=206335 RepID=A0A9P5PKD6_9AGAR|nr:hypothetical protein BDP27DRAFT_1425469 [Rhodocollybia butyracea]